MKTRRIPASAMPWQPVIMGLALLLWVGGAGSTTARDRLFIEAGESGNGVPTKTVQEEGPRVKPKVLPRVEGGRTGPLSIDPGTAIRISNTSIRFDQSNIKTGEIIDIDNTSGVDQAIGIQLPEVGILLGAVVRKPEQTKVMRGQLDSFTVKADAGIIIAIIPDADPDKMRMLDGQEVVITVYQTNKVSETYRIPIEVASDLRL